MKAAGVVRGAGIGGLAVAIGGLAFGGADAAVLFWTGVVPLLPILFLINPALWRNSCPLATLSWGGPTTGAPGAMPRRGAPPMLPGILVLLVLIGLRGVWFSNDGSATAVLLASVAVVAAVEGRRAPGKAGFCNRFCPILPVERLYGQSPLIEVANTRCTPCDLCGPRACLDLNPKAALPQVLGPSRHSHGWLFQPFGAFAAALPGVVHAFGRLGGDATAPVVALSLLLGAFVSWTAAAVVVNALSLGWRVAIPSLGAAAAGFHLWSSLPGIVAAWELPLDTLPVRWAALVLVAAWWLRAIDSPRRSGLVSITTRRR